MLVKIKAVLLLGMYTFLIITTKNENILEIGHLVFEGGKCSYLERWRWASCRNNPPRRESKGVPAEDCNT
jgi:hypothetical protein